MIKVSLIKAVKLLGDVLRLLPYIFMEKGVSILTQKPKECWNDLLFAYLLARMREEIANMISGEL